MKYAILPKLIFCLPGIILLLAGCERPLEVQDEPTLTATAVTAATPAPTITPLPTRTPTITPSPTPEPLRPLIEAGEQVIGEDGRITIERVVAPEPGWLLVYTVEQGEAVALLAHTAVAEGEHNDLALTLDPLQTSDTILLALYLAGDSLTEAGLLDDGAAATARAAATATVAADVQVVWPAVTVADQDVADDGLVRLARVTAPAPGWLVIQADAAGAPGPILGQTYVNAGDNENVVVALNWRLATPRLHAALHYDYGRATRFDVDTDLIVVARGRPVSAYFDVTLPPDILVLDQPVVNDQVEIERVISNGPGWLVIYYNENGAPGRIIGQAFLEDGLNERVVVPVVARAVTSILFALLHQDTGITGDFEFPAADPPLLYRGRLAEPAPFRIDQGNYLATRDQALTAAAELIVPLAVVATPGWLVVFADNDGELGDILGQTWIPAGISREVAVAVGTTAVTPTLHVVLHQDAGEVERFEFPDGPDTPMTRNQRMIRVPMTLVNN
jgi:hypothetical protein